MNGSKTCGNLLPPVALILKYVDIINDILRSNYIDVGLLKLLF